MSTLSLPSYTRETPSYTAQPRGNERTLGFTTRQFRRPADRTISSDWSKTLGNVTLTLLNQPQYVHRPVYGRLTIIEGFLTLRSTEGVASIHIRLEGHVKCKTIAEIGRSDVKVLDTVINLWSQEGSQCPSLLPFKIPLPATYTWGEQSGPLPPTFEYTFYDLQGGTPGLRATIKYELSVKVEPVHASLKDKLSSSLCTPLIYHPRSRPGKPPSGSPTTTFEAVMEYRRGGKSKELDPIVWKLHLPQPGVYAITQPIPFRVAVTSRSSSLIAPFGPNSKDKALTRVYILRQVSIKVNATDLWRSFVTAEGKLTYLPQNNDEGLWLKNVSTSSVHSGGSVGSASEKEGWASHNWTGVLNIDQTQVTVGGFQAGGMTVKDFIILSVVPPNPRLGSLLEVKRIIPIQLTTDTWDGIGPTSLADIADDYAQLSPNSNGYLEGRGEGRHIEPPYVQTERNNNRNGMDGSNLI